MFRFARRSFSATSAMHKVRRERSRSLSRDEPLPPRRIPLSSVGLVLFGAGLAVPHTLVTNIAPLIHEHPVETIWYN